MNTLPVKIKEVVELSKIEDLTKAENDRIAKIESELSKGDVAKINDLKTDLIALKTKYEFKSKKNQLLYQSFGLLIEKIINFINK